MEHFEWDRPIILIGAGRSGSTLLSAIIGEHPDVFAAGETSFLLNRLWNEFFAKPEYVRNFRVGKLLQETNPEWKSWTWHDFWHTHLNRNLNSHNHDAVSQIELTEERRLSQLLGKHMAESLVPPILRKRLWSIKEVWNGSSSFPHGWSRHDQAYEQARYVHVIRHPWTWVQSYLQHQHTHSSVKDVEIALQEWVKMVQCACRQEQHQGRYHSMRLEDFIGQQEATLSRVFNFLDLPSSPKCNLAAKKHYLSRQRHHTLPQLSESDLERIPGLTEMMNHCGYESFFDETILASIP